MPVTQGTLDKKEQEIIRRNRPYLVENMDVTHFMDYCVNEDLLTIPEVIQLDDEKLNRKDRNRMFLDLLFRSGDNAYKKFVNLLADHGGEEIANQLRRTEKGPLQLSDATQDSIQLTEEQRNCQIGPRDMMMFAHALPVSDLDSLGFALGLEANEIDTIKIDYHVHGVRTQRLYILTRWQQKQGRKATIGSFIECLKDAQKAGVNIDWDGVQNTIIKIRK